MPIIDMHAAKREREASSPAAMIRAALDYYEEYGHPRVSREYWRTHVPGEDEAPPAELAYWHRAFGEMGRLNERFEGDPFMSDLLCAVYRQFDREYEAARRDPFPLTGNDGGISHE